MFAKEGHLIRFKENLLTTLSVLLTSMVKFLKYGRNTQNVECIMVV